MKKLLLFSFFFALFIKINAQKDQVTLKTGETLTVKIAEVTPSQIKFLKTLDGPIYSLNKSEVFMIVYEDGRKQLFEQENNSNIKNKKAKIEDEDEVLNPSKHYGGPRIGGTFIDQGTSRVKIAEAFNRGAIQPVITQFGWQFETQIFKLKDGSKALFEFVPMIGGLEQGLFLPSATTMFGYRTKRGLEFGMGPSLSLSGVGVSFAAGFSFKSGGVTFPINLVFSPSIAKTTIAGVTSHSGSRVSLIIGFSTYKRWIKKKLMIMKNIFSFGIILFSVLTSFSQDTIVNNKGLIFSGTIISSDSLFLSYKSNESLISEVNLVNKSTILLVKYSNGRVDQLYKNDTLMTKTGDKIIAKILEIDSDMLSYFRFNGKINSIQITPLASLFMYQLSNGEKVVITKKPQDNTDYSALGEADAEKYYKTAPGFIAGEVVLGVTFWAGALTLVPGIILPLIKPVKLESSRNPNNALLKSNPAYKLGFEKKAARKKSSAGFKALGAGIAGSILALIAILAYSF